MNTPSADADEDLRYAEYVLGVLDADARAAVESEIARAPEVAAAVAWWQSRLMPLADSIGEVTPAPHVWARIQEATQPRVAPRLHRRAPLWDNLPVWRALGIGASVLAIALLVVVLLRPLSPEVSASYLASSLQQNDGSIGWTATLDLQHERLVVIPAMPAVLAQGRAPELWLIPAGGRPIAVGMIGRNGPTTLALNPALRAQLSQTAALAVSVEPPGGSPSGQPTGPVIAHGSIGSTS